MCLCHYDCATLRVKLFYVFHIFLENEMSFHLHGWSNFSSRYREISWKNCPFLDFLRIGGGSLVVPVNASLDGFHYDCVRIPQDLVQGLGFRALLFTPLDGFLC